MRVIILMITFLVIGCTPKNYYGNANRHSTYSGKYKSFLKQGETEIYTHYNEVVSKTSDGAYIYRSFFPETSQITSEVYFNNKNLELKEGPAKYWNDNGNLVSEGIHKNGDRHDHWKFYSRKSGLMHSEGSFVYGKKNGVWKYYDTKGRLMETKTYISGTTEGEFVAYDSTQVVINTGVCRADTVFSETNPGARNPDKPLSQKVVEVMPYMRSCNGIDDVEERKKCSDRDMLRYIYGNIKYPADARERDVEGTALCEFVIEKDGSVSDVDVYVGLCQSIKNECERVVRGMPPFYPGTQDGEPVRVMYTLPIKFKLE